MKKIFTYIFIIFCIITLVGCGTVMTLIDSVELTKTEGLKDTYTIYFGDGTIFEFVVTNGKDGETGAPGEKGENGDSVVNAYVNEELHLIIVLSNGKEIDAGYVGVEIDSSLNIAKYKVIFKDYDGTELYSEIVEKGKSATAPDAPSREGFEFIGWDKEFDNITSDLEITALYKEKIEEVNVFSIVSVDNGDGTITVTLSSSGKKIKYAGMDGYLEFDNTKLTVVGKAKKQTELSGSINVSQSEGKVWIALAGDTNVENEENLFSVTFSYTGALNTTLNLVIEDIFDINFEKQEYSIKGGGISID